MHRQVQIRPGDMVILSSTAVPGNEKMVSNVVNSLMEKGAEVIYNDIAETHVSGHASGEELKLIHTLLKPRYFMPVHGEMKHLIAHAEIAESLGMDRGRILFGTNGDVFELVRGKAKKSKETVPAGAVMVDGLGIGDVGSSVLNERRYLSEAGLIVMAACFENGSLVSGPQLISKGFVYVKEQKNFLEEAREVVEEELMYCLDSGRHDVNAMADICKGRLRNFIYEKTERSPVIIPVFMEV
jgi:ribonuclease J